MACQHHYVLERSPRADGTHGTCKHCGHARTWVDSGRMVPSDWRATNAVSFEAVAHRKRMLNATVIS